MPRFTGLGPRFVQRGASAVPPGALTVATGAAAGSAPRKPLGGRLEGLAGYSWHFVWL